jgi:predicted alpha/beta superfamily hydrolase
MVKFFLFLGLLPFAAYSQNSKLPQPFVIGEIQKINSTILKEERIINVYLPVNYNPDSLKKYPVIYLLDGSKDEDFIHIAGLVQFGSFPWLNKIEETIVVGIENVDRKRDFTFKPRDTTYYSNIPTAGGSREFIQFLAEELQPFVRENYQVNDKETIIGQSLGGLLVTEILMNHTALFDNYIIISPSLWWDSEKLLRTDFNLSNSPDAIYIGVGKEGRIMEGEAKDLYKKLKKQKFNSTKLYFNFFKQCSHADVLHLAVYDAFEKIFAQ